MKSIWVEGDVRRFRRGTRRTIALWILELACLALFALWVYALASGGPVGGRLHGWLAGAVVLSVPVIFVNFRYAEYLGPTMFRWKRGSRLLHARPRPSPPQGDAPTPEDVGRAD